METTDRLIGIIADRKAFDDAPIMILEAAETKELRSVNFLPSFSDGSGEDRVMGILERVTGKGYKK